MPGETEIGFQHLDHRVNGQQLRPPSEWAASTTTRHDQNSRSRVEPPVGIEPTTYSLRASWPHVRRHPPRCGNRLVSGSPGLRRTPADGRELGPKLRPCGPTPR